MSVRSLEARNYVATKSDIEALARQNLEAAKARMAVRATYLRALLATTQHELEKGEKPRSKGDIPDWQIATLEAVHTRFYAPQGFLRNYGATNHVQWRFLC